METNRHDRNDGAGIDVSVVIITWRMREYLGVLLTSLYEFTAGPRIEVIVIDNNSADGTVEMVQRQFPGVRLMVNSTNRGVAPARNQGFRCARGKYILTLDADMRVMENSIAKMVAFMEETPDAGVCGAKLIGADGWVQPTARRYPTPLAFVLRRLPQVAFVRNSKTLKYHEMADWDRRDTRVVDYVIGACQFIRRRAMQETGLLDEHIFYGPEDIDFCLRMYKKGWKVYYYAGTEIVHYEQRVTKRKLLTPLSWHHLKGVIYIFRKYNWRLRAY